MFCSCRQLRHLGRGTGSPRRPDLCPCPAPGHGYHGLPPTAAGPGETVARPDRRTRCSADPDFKIRCHGETKKAAQRFDGIDARTIFASAVRPTRSTGTDASVTFRPLIL